MKSLNIIKPIRRRLNPRALLLAALALATAFGLNSAQAAAPTVAITSPVAGAPVDDISFTIVATATASPGTITSVTFYDGATQLGDPVTTSPYTRTITGATLGAHVLTAKAIDSDLNETVSAAVTVRAATNVLLNKTVACQHYYYGGAGQGGLVDNKPSTFNFFSRIPDNWTPDNDLRVSVSNFNSAVGKVRYWGEYYKGSNCRSLNSVTIYSSTTATTSLATGDYTLCGTFSIPLNTVFTPPAGWTTVITGGNYYDFPISAPSGTKSLLLTFGNTGIPGNIANNINEIQAFAPPPAPPVVAITNPLESASVPAASFAIDATATDEGTITSVTFFIDDVQIGAPDTAPPYSIVMTGATPGAHALTAKALDNDLNEVTSAAVNITVTATNQAPVATLTSPLDAASYVQGMSIPLAATATDDGGVASVTFYYNDGSGDVQIGDPVTTAPYTSTWTGATAGSYTVTAVARDFESVPSSPSSVSITVTANQAPVATLTSPLAAASYVEGMSIALAATATDDLGVASVTFYYNDGGADVQIGAPVTTAPYTLTWTGATLGSHTVKAVALDTGAPGLTSAASSASITVTANQAPEVTLTSPLDAASYVEGVDIPLAATATDDVGVASVTFYDGDTQIGSPVTTAPYTLTWNTATQGAHTVKAVALDTGGLPSAPSSVSSITVTANEPPYNVAITSPAADSTQAQNFPFTISATAQVTYGTITKVEFYDGSTLLGTDTTDPFSYAATVAVTGDHTLTAKAFGSGGLFTVSAPVYVKVAPNLLENKTVACQHYWYGENGQAGLVNNNPATFNFFSGPPADNFAPDSDLRVSVSNFNSAVGKARYWGSPYADPGGNRSLNGVTIYSSTTATTSLDPADYTSCGTFSIPLLSGGPTLPAGWAQDSANRCYYDIAISAPTGTQSLLFMFTHTGISGNFANNIDKIQAFAPLPAPLATITSPAEGKFVDDLSFTITADATVPTGHIAKVEFYDNNVLVGTDEALPYTCTITGATLGAHVLVAKAMDNNSEWIVSAPVNVTAATNLLGGKPIACNAPWNDGGLWRMNNNVVDYDLFGVDNYGWYTDNQIAITGFDSDISIIRVWGTPFSNDGRKIQGFTFKSSTTDLTAGSKLDPANYENDLGDHPLPLVAPPAPPAAGWTAVTGANFFPPYAITTFYYYDVAVSVPSGTKSLLIHAYGPSQYSPNLPEIQAFASAAPPVGTTTLVSTSGIPSTFGASVTLTATVAPAPTTGGTVQFHDNGTDLGAAANVDTGTGIATLSTSALTVGSHTITATYSGASGFATSEDLVGANQTVNPARSAYELWSDQITNGKTGAAQDADDDAVPNFIEFAFNGNPMSAADNGMIHVGTENSTFYGGKVLVLTVAVRAGTPAEWTDNTATIDGLTYTIEGGTTLDNFNSSGTIVGPFDNNTYAPDISTQGYEWRRFVLTGSVGLGSKGFLRARVEQN